MLTSWLNRVSDLFTLKKFRRTQNKIRAIRVVQRYFGLAKEQSAANEMRSKVMNIYFSNDRSLQQSPFTEFFLGVLKTSSVGVVLKMFSCPSSLTMSLHGGNRPFYSYEFSTLASK